FEKVPAADMPVHVHLLFEKGIHLIEALQLEELAEAGVKEFLFVGAPLKLEGATGAPMRPLAIL
ncbi:MAG: cyclase family protein, partial [Acidobacteria bacterium]|nr:cyclase family protein [Acidobacteriota bacterium]